MSKRSQRQSNPAPTQTQGPAKDASTPPAPQATPAASSPQPPAPTQTQGPAKTPEAPVTVEMLLKKDVWDESGQRQKAGTTVSFSPEVARKLNKAGKAEKFDPLLQGED